MHNQQSTANRCKIVNIKVHNFYYKCFSFSEPPLSSVFVCYYLCCPIVRDGPGFQNQTLLNKYISLLQAPSLWQPAVQGSGHSSRHQLRLHRLKCLKKETKVFLSSKLRVSTLWENKTDRKHSIPFIWGCRTPDHTEYTEFQAFPPVVRIGSPHPLSRKRVLLYV